MILVTVGTQRFPFDRLFKEIDKLVENKVITEEIVAQVGHTNCKPKNFKVSKLINAEEMDHLIKESNLVITHAGTSSIIKCLKEGKKVIVIPRLKKYGEHIDDHQLEIAQLFDQQGFIEPVYEIHELKNKLELVKTKKYKSYNFNNQILLQSIDAYLTKLSNC